MKQSLLCLALFLVAACTAISGPPRGQAIGRALEDRPIEPLARVIESPEVFANQTILVEARVEGVCKKAGCWMKIADRGRVAMVRWESGCGGEFTFPKDAAGRRVLVQGSIYPKTISEPDAKHIEEEADGKVAIPRETFEMNASAVLLLDE